mmetsp:Transcript_9134/g.28888  ORF Transcript_9134/g.28888 Transcript_9134/m.28888 type:complete len:283 (-) Transcript_9134:148-996(-)
MAVFHLQWPQATDRHKIEWRRPTQRTRSPHRLLHACKVALGGNRWLPRTLILGAEVGWTSRSMRPGCYRHAEPDHEQLDPAGFEHVPHMGTHSQRSDQQWQYRKQRCHCERQTHLLHHLQHPDNSQEHGCTSRPHGRCANWTRSPTPCQSWSIAPSDRLAPASHPAPSTVQALSGRGAPAPTPQAMSHLQSRSRAGINAAGGVPNSTLAHPCAVRNQCHSARRPQGWGGGQRSTQPQSRVRCNPRTRQQRKGCQAGRRSIQALGVEQERPNLQQDQTPRGGC